MRVPGRRLGGVEREWIEWLRDRGAGVREIARVLGRDPSTVSRELRRNASASPRKYRALQAGLKAGKRARRSGPRKLAPGTALRAAVAAMLRDGLSPHQVAGRLAREHPDDESMQISHSAIYYALYVQGKGSLRAEIGTAIRAGKSRRRSASGETRGKIPGMINISQRPPEAADRAVPGHWEGDLIIGKGGQSAVATVAERASRFCLIIALPQGRTADKVAAALADRIGALPAALKRSLTWDQGKEMTEHARFTIATGVPVYFADPHSPWQRGTNENTNGLIRYYLPKGTDLSIHSQAALDDIARKLNTRPRKTLGFRTPAEALNDLLVATRC